MRFLYWTIFWFLLGPSSGWGLEKENFSLGFSEPVNFAVGLMTTDIAPRAEIDVIANKLASKAAPDIHVASKEKISVVKKNELKSVLDSVYKKHRAYFSMNRYERTIKASSNKKQSQLQIELTRDIEPTIRVIDKPLALGGDGFNTAGLEADEYKLHFTFNNHIKTSTIYAVEKESVNHFDPDFEKAQSEKFLIFHRSSLNFGRQANLAEAFKLKQPVEQKMVYAKVEAVPSSWIFLDAHVKDFQNKETSIRLLPAIKRLDLIYDDPAILQYDYQILNSGGS